MLPSASPSSSLSAGRRSPTGTSWGFAGRGLSLRGRQFAGGGLGFAQFRKRDALFGVVILPLSFRPLCPVPYLLRSRSSSSSPSLDSRRSHCDKDNEGDGLCPEDTSRSDYPRAGGAPKEHEREVRCPSHRTISCPWLSAPSLLTPQRTKKPPDPLQSSDSFSGSLLMSYLGWHPIFHQGQYLLTLPAFRWKLLG